MKKIYAKFTKERASQFQIETALYLDQSGHKYARKYPLTDACKEHLVKMHDNNQYFVQKGVNLFAPCAMKGDAVEFPFVTGSSYYDLLLEAARKRDAKAFYAHLEAYRDTVTCLYPAADCQPFSADAQFHQIFGEVQGLETETAVAKLDIDLTFDNIIIQPDGQVQIIDYEWMFDCLVPLAFAFFRAVKAICVKDGKALEGFVSAAELYAFFGITNEAVAVYEAMNESFMDYVNGYERSYEQILEAYKKPVTMVLERVDSDVRHAMVFIDCGEGYSPESCIFTAIPREDGTVSLDIKLDAYANLLEVRVDPVDISGIIRMKKCFVETIQGRREILIEGERHNGAKGEDGTWIFDNPDPQILIDVRNQQAKRLVMEYEIVMSNLEKYASYSQHMKEKLSLASQTQERHQRIIAEQTLGSEDLKRQLLDYERKNHLLKDKLAYIENTKAYRYLLKKKVDNITLWDEIRE